jgi:predicted ATP-grasp superfamily ATP-dependent carboligase
MVLPSLEAARTVLEKDRFDAYAQQHGVPVPHTWAFSDLDELRQEAAHLPYPLAVKPLVSTHWHGAVFTSAFGHIKMLRVDSPAELVACVARIAAVAPMPLLQEFVVGGDHEHYSYVSYRNREGVELCGVLVQKLRLNPIRFGLGTCARSVRNEQMETIGRHVTATLPYHSVASVCFKRDVRTGAPMVFEVNGRLPLNFPAIGVAGMNLPFLMYRDALGDSPLPATVTGYGRLWTTLSHDIWAMRGYQRAGELSFAQWLWSYREVKQVLEFDWRDPGPGIALAAEMFKGKFRRADG